jgi:ADP-ribose pyrophosphatase YjhB (NUDIX family)
MQGIFAASVALLYREQVLLIQRNRPPSEGLWTLPGGRLEAGETAEQCAEREIREELGLAVFALRPITVLMHRQYRLQVFATEAFEGDIVPDPGEVRAWSWVRPEHVHGMATTPGLGNALEGAFRLFDRR